MHKGIACVLESHLECSGEGAMLGAGSFNMFNRFHITGSQSDPLKSQERVQNQIDQPVLSEFTYSVLVQ